MNIALWFNLLQSKLFPALEEELGPLSENESQFVRIVELCNLTAFMTQFQWKENGRKPHSRLSLAKAFIAKSVWNLTTTESLIDFLRASASLRRLCGWETVKSLPDRSTFSRAFEQFAQSELPQRIHAHLIQTQFGSDEVIGHVSIDSTAIVGREAVTKTATAAASGSEPLQATARKRGRPRKGEEPPAREPKRLDLQGQRTLEDNLQDIPCQCDTGVKRNSKGYQESWRGFKLHLAANDLDIPLCGILSSASLHDSQAAIPLMQSTREVVAHSLYDLFDSAYDAPQIAKFSSSLGHVPIIDPNPRCSANPRQLAPHEKSRLKERSAVERVNSNLKDNWGGRFVRVRGAAKVACHLFFGVLAMTADRLIDLFKGVEEADEPSTCQN